MTDVLMSRFETYLLDEELWLESKDEELLVDCSKEFSNQEGYPQGFFTSL